MTEFLTELLIYGAFASVIFLGIVLSFLPSGPRRHRWHEVSSSDIAAAARKSKRLRKAKQAFDQLYPKGPLAPEVIRVVGGCGVTGCPNTRPHSHVDDLARRMKGK